MNKTVFVFILIFVLAFSYSSQSQADVKGGTFKYALSVHPVTLNPITAADNYSLEVMPWMVETLLTRDENTYEWQPALAESYEISKDKQTIYFTLRKDVRFHDGSLLTAEDVAFSVRVHQITLYGASAELENFKTFDRIEIQDPLHIRFHADKALFSNLETLATVPIVPKKVYEKKADMARLNRTITGTGPYKLKQYHMGYRLLLEANSKWWGRSLPEFKDKFNFGEILVRFVEDDHLKIQMLEKGELDYAGISLTTMMNNTNKEPWGTKFFAEKASPANLFTSQSSYFINLRKPIFSGLKTRQALQMLLDRKLINDKLRYGKSVLATGPWHRLGDYSDSSVEPVEYNEAKARKLLKEDGWIQNEEGLLHKVINDKDTVFRFTFMFPRRDLEKELTIFQGSLKQAGIQMDLQQVDWSVFIKNLDELQYDAFVVGRGWPWVIDFNPKSEWNSKFIEKGKGNNIGYQNKEVDALMDQAELEWDRPRRMKLLKKVYKLAAKDQSQIFTFSEPASYYAHSSRLKIVKPYYKYSIGINNWWIEEH